MDYKGYKLIDTIMLVCRDEAEHDDSHGVFLQVQRHAVRAVGEANQFVRHAIIQTGHTRDTIADHDNGTGIRLGDLILVMLDLLFDELGDFFRFQLHCITAFSR